MDDNNFYNYDTPEQLNAQVPEPNYHNSPPPNSMATASLVLGIISLVLCCCAYFSVPLGVLGIIFAILSKGHSRKMSGRAKTGLGLSIGGCALAVVLFIGMIISMQISSSFANPYSDLDDLFNHYYENYDENYNAPDEKYDFGDSI